MKLALCLAVTTALLALPAWGDDPTLFAYDDDAAEWVTLNPADGMLASVLVPSSPAVFGGTARDPQAGTLYEGYQDKLWIRDDADAAMLSSVDFSGFADVRDIAIDDAGRGWAVTGADNGYRLYFFNVGTGAGTLLAGMGSRSAIAWAQELDKVFILVGDILLISFDPDTPASMTNVSLTGDSLPNTNWSPAFVYDPNQDAFLLGGHTGNWYRISPAGVVTRVGNGSGGQIRNLAFDHATTALPVELDSFRVE